MFCMSAVVDNVEETLLESIYKEYRRSMFSAAYSIAENRYDAEDILQNTFLKIASNMDKIKRVDKASLGAYLTVVTKNCAIDYLRAKKNDLFKEEDKIEHIPDRRSTEAQVLEKMDINRVVAAIHKLKSPYKEVLMLHYLFDHSHQDIAELTGRSTSTVRKQVSRGRATLLNSLKGDEIRGK